jgi:hypothetical protein
MSVGPLGDHRPPPQLTATSTDSRRREAAWPAPAGRQQSNALRGPVQPPGNIGETDKVLPFDFYDAQTRDALDVSDGAQHGVDQILGLAMDIGSCRPGFVALEGHVRATSLE